MQPVISLRTRLSHVGKLAISGATLSSNFILALCLVLTGACSSSQKSSGTNSGSPGGDYQGHGAASVPPEVIRQFAPPALDGNVARTIQAMLDVRSPGLGLLSPDGKRLYFGWSVSGTPQVWRIQNPKGFPQQMTGGNDVTQAHAISEDGKWLVVSRDRNGEENPGLYLQSLNGGPLKEILHKPGVKTSFNWISPDGHQIVYTANNIKQDSFAIYRYDIASGKNELLFSEPGYWALADVRSDGRYLLVLATGSTSREFSLFDPTTKKAEPLLGQGEKEEYEVSFGTKTGEYFVLTNKFSDFRRLYRFIKSSAREFTPLTADKKMDVDSFNIDEQRRRVLVSWNQHGYSKIEAYDAKTFQPLEMPSFDGADQIYVGTISKSGRYVTLGVETATAPRTSYIYDWQTHKLTQWVLPSSPEIDTSRFSAAKLEYYPARDGTKIPMFVRRPSKCSTKPCPVVVHFHGGPEAQTRPGFSPYAQLFINAGFIFAEPNVRGSDGYGKIWLDSDNGPKRLSVVTDIEDAAVYIKKFWSENGQDPRIGIMGGSYGGYSTLYGMTRFAGAYDAGVASVGMSNLVTFLMNTAPYRRILRISEYGDPEKDRDALLELSPVTHLAKTKNPLLIIQGVSDPRVPAGEAIQMHEALQGKGLSSQLVLFADEGHGSVKRENRVLEIGHAVAFFQKHLLPQAAQTRASR